ncbi:MAG: FtsW/RodA/SpoVE family cell cycle protein, partial [Paracoccaceae bacterium]|nr:FtsW/RodA/SpoVE family cell cycle protein [Paracoccaceae bacterium]
MTEMVYGFMPTRVREPVIPRWWRTIDKWSFTAVFILFAIGILLGLAASVPLAARNDLEPFYYVQRQVFFGTLSMVVMVSISMMSPATLRRLGTLGFLGAFIALLALIPLGTDLGKGAVRWLNLGFITVQPSEFVKPGFIILAAWLIGASFDINGPPGRLISFVLAVVIVGL